MADSGSIKYVISADGKQAVDTFGKVGDSAKKMGTQYKSAADQFKKMKAEGRDYREMMSAEGMAIQGFGKMGFSPAMAGLMGGVAALGLSKILDVALASYEETVQRAKEQAKKAITDIEAMVKISQSVSGYNPASIDFVSKQFAITPEESKEILDTTKDVMPERMGDKDYLLKIIAASVAAKNKGTYSKERLTTLLNSGAFEYDDSYLTSPLSFFSAGTVGKDGLTGPDDIRESNKQLEKTYEKYVQGNQFGMKEARDRQITTQGRTEQQIAAYNKIVEYATTGTGEVKEYYQGLLNEPQDIRERRMNAEIFAPMWTAAINQTFSSMFSELSESKIYLREIARSNTSIEDKQKQSNIIMDSPQAK